jgi:hypothetical protein
MVREADQKAVCGVSGGGGKNGRGDVPNASQKKIAPAFLVVHHPPRPVLNSSPFSLA